MAPQFERRHFADEQRRNRRQSRRFSVVAVPAVIAAGIPLCIIVSPLVFAAALLAVALWDLVAPLSPEVWAGLARIAVRCLEKQPEERFQSARDLAFALEALSGTGESRALSAAQSPTSRKSWALGGALLHIGLAAGGSLASMLKQPPPCSRNTVH